MSSLCSLPRRLKDFLANPKQTLMKSDSSSNVSSRTESLASLCLFFSDCTYSLALPITEINADDCIKQANM